jgi:mono/diheme cytochrome c family protein
MQSGKIDPTQPTLRHDPLELLIMAIASTTVTRALGIAAIVTLAGAWSAIVYSAYRVAAISPDPWPVTTLMHYASDRAVAARYGNVRVPKGLNTPAAIEAGAIVFGKNCVTCHGGLGLTPTRIAQGFTPSPPSLFRAGRDAEPDETFWFIKNGVKLTGMPGFGPTLSNSEIWSLTAFLTQVPSVSTPVYARQSSLAVTAIRASD